MHSLCSNKHFKHRCATLSSHDLIRLHVQFSKYRPFMISEIQLLYILIHICVKMFYLLSVWSNIVYTVTGDVAWYTVVFSEAPCIYNEYGKRALVVHVILFFFFRNRLFAGLLLVNLSPICLIRVLGHISPPCIEYLFPRRSARSHSKGNVSLTNVTLVPCEGEWDNASRSHASDLPAYIYTYRQRRGWRVLQVPFILAVAPVVTPRTVV